MLSFFSSSQEFEPKWLLGIAASKLGETKLAYACLSFAGQKSFGAALAGM